jgi:Putative lumazine-binding
MRKAFHPDAKVFSFRDGKLNQMTSAEFYSRAAMQEPPFDSFSQMEIPEFL